MEMEKAHLTACDHLTGIKPRQKDYYNRTAREQRFEVGMTYGSYAETGTCAYGCAENDINFWITM